MKKVENFFKGEVDQETIGLLKDLLGKAECGELSSLIFVDMYRDGKCGHGWAGRPDMVMIGELENVKFDFLSHMYFPVEG